MVWSTIKETVDVSVSDPADKGATMNWSISVAGHDTGSSDVLKSDLRVDWVTRCVVECVVKIH